MKKLHKLNWWIVLIIIFIGAVLNKLVTHLLPETSYEEYTMHWFAAKIPYATLRFIITFSIAYFFIGLKNIIGWKKIRWHFLLWIPIFYYLIRPGLVDYSKFELSSTILASIAMVIGVTQEELFSRGIVYNHIKKVSNGFVAILISSIIFGLLHHSFTGPEAFHIDKIIDNALAPSILGLVFGTIYHFSKSLPLVILLHLIWNITNLFWLVGVSQ